MWWRKWVSVNPKASRLIYSPPLFRNCKALRISESSHTSVQLQDQVIPANSGLEGGSIEKKDVKSSQLMSRKYLTPQQSERTPQIESVIQDALSWAKRRLLLCGIPVLRDSKMAEEEEM